jgi:UDP-glucose 4-epimerase
MATNPNHDLHGARILVTGASGFIGSHLCARLSAAGGEVHVSSRQQEPMALCPGQVWHQTDLEAPAAVAGLMGQVRPDVVFHLASRVAGSRDRSLVLPTFHANLASAVYLLDAAAEQGVRRFLQVGSLEEPEPGEPIATPSSPYAAAKWGASAYARMYHRLYGFPVVLARLFMVYGPGQRDLTKLVPYLVTSLLADREVKVSSGRRPVDWIYVEDVVEGLVLAATADGVDGRVVDLGSGQLVPVRTVVERLFELLAPGEIPPLGTLADRAMEQVRVARVEDTRERLGWAPSTPLDVGLERTVEWYRSELAAGRLELPPVLV